MKNPPVVRFQVCLQVLTEFDCRCHQEAALSFPYARLLTGHLPLQALLWCCRSVEARYTEPDIALSLSQNSLRRGEITS